MNPEDYKIIIILSHHRIAYEYWQHDGEDGLVGMPGNNWPAPLAFYCSNTGIRIGDDAANAARLRTPNAFDNYFDLVASDVTYTTGDQTRPIRNILLDASERIFRDFFRRILIRLGDLSDNRAKMPLSIVCEGDIRSHERALLSGLFKDSGYSKVRVMCYDDVIEKYLRETLALRYDCEKVLVAWTEGDDLTLTLFDIRGMQDKRQTIMEGLGVDPRLDYVKGLIRKRISGQNPFMTFDERLDDIISKEASDFLNSNAPLVDRKKLSIENYDYYYSLNRLQIDSVQSDEGVRIKRKLEDFLRANGVEDRRKVLLLLRGSAAGNNYFENTLKQGFKIVLPSDKDLRENVMRLILTWPTPTPHSDPEPIKILERRWREIKAQSLGNIRDGHTDKALQQLHEFVAECETVSGADSIIQEVSNIIGELMPRPKPQPSEDKLKSLRKRWREIKALCSGYVRGGHTDKALQQLSEFKTECEAVPGADSIIQEVNDIIAESMPRPKPQPSEDTLKSLRKRWRENKAQCLGYVRGGHTDKALQQLRAFKTECEAVPGADNITQEVSNTINELTQPSKPIASSSMSETRDSNSKKPKTRDVRQESPKKKDKGKELLENGKLKEARDWYKSVGDTAQSRLLTDLLCKQKSVETRKRSLDNCRKTKNMEQINRIIDELSDYIDLCDKVGYNATEFRALLREYKKIK